MLPKKSLFLAIIILLLSAVPAIQAAPPLQGGPQGRKALRDTFNLDNQGNVMKHQNLGAIMPGPKANDGSGEHPVLRRIANYFDVSYEQVQALHAQGYGPGIIAKAHFFSQEFGASITDLLDGQVHGWGNALKAQGIHPGSIKGRGPNKAGPPGQVGKPDKANRGGGAADDDDDESAVSDDDDDDSDDDGDRRGNGKAKGKNKGQGSAGDDEDDISGDDDDENEDDDEDDNND